MLSFLLLLDITNARLARAISILLFTFYTCLNTIKFMRRYNFTDILLLTPQYITVWWQPFTK